MITAIIYLLCLTPLAYLAVQATVLRVRTDRASEARRKADEAWWAQYNAKKALRAQMDGQKVSYVSG